LSPAERSRCLPTWCSTPKSTLGRAGDAYELAARLDVSLPGVELDVAERLIEAAHQICSYSRATKGNIGAAIRLV
jgi:lipoyl-dependent peroxiredoxin